MPAVRPGRRLALLKALGRRLQSVDWVIVALIAAFLFVVPFPGLPAGALGWTVAAVRRDPFAAYERALRDAAIRKPGDDMKLATIENARTKIEVGTFAGMRSGLALGETKLRKGEMWVFLPEQLHEACKDASDAAFTIRQILGLPPRNDARVIYTIIAERRDLFRPCMSGPDLSVLTCKFSAPPHFDSESFVKTMALEKLGELISAYEHLWFMVNHMSQANTIGFSWKYGAPGDYPNNGFPFTGMGWTYDWRPSRGSHFGVTEFVIRRDAVVTVQPAVSPQEFCSPKK